MRFVQRTQADETSALPVVPAWESNGADSIQFKLWKKPNQPRINADDSDQNLIWGAGESDDLPGRWLNLAGSRRVGDKLEGVGRFSSTLLL